MEFRKVLNSSQIESLHSTPDEEIQLGRMELLGLDDGLSVTKSEFLQLINQIDESGSYVEKGQQRDESPTSSQSPQSASSNIPVASDASNRIIHLQKGAMIVSRILKVLRRNSACCFDDEFRFAYEHGIRSRLTDCIDGVVQSRSRRVSITLRTVRTDGCCDCSWPLWCDTQNRSCHRPPTRLKST